MTLADFVCKIIEQKHLSAAEVSRKAGDIAESSVLKIMHGETKHPSVPKLKSLARGLGISEQELFEIEGVEFSTPWPPSAIIRAIDRITTNRDLSQIVSLLLDKSDKDLAKIRRQLIDG